MRKRLSFLVTTLGKTFKSTALFVTIFSLILFLVTVTLRLGVNAQVASGLVAAYGFNEGLGTTTADASGLNNNGTLSGATWTAAGKYGGAVSFDGINDLVNIADSASLDLTTGMTLEAWVNPSSTVGSKTVIFKERGTTNVAYTLYSSSDVNTPWTAFTDSSGAIFDLNGPSQLPINTWTHLAVTYDKTALRLYVNGALVRSLAATPNIGATANPLRIGGSIAWGEYYQGVIDEVRVYNRALTQAEIQTDMNTPIGSPSQPTPTPTSGPTPTPTPTPTAGPTPTPTPTPTPSQDASLVGQWSPVLPWPHIAIHGILLPNGKVLTFASGNNASVWDPTTGTFTSVPNSTTNLFCAGHALLADGKVIIVGGETDAALGIKDTNIFNSTTQTWTKVADMSYLRWYPTATVLPDGRVLAVSGGQMTQTDLARIPEIYNPATNTWTQLPGANALIQMYPHLFVLPNGKVVLTGASEYMTDTRVLDIATQTWTIIDAGKLDGGSSTMYQPGKIMKSGTSSAGELSDFSATTTYVLDMNQPTPAWRQTASMAFPRAYHNLTNLPDGTVLVTGGLTVTAASSMSQAVKAAEVWNPATETWRTLASMQTGRSYHSIGILLPDARVLVSGTGFEPGVPNTLNSEIFSPPYLFKGPRPAITSAPAILGYGSSFTVQTPDAASIASVSLIRTGAVTHAFDENARFTNLSFQQTVDGLLVTAPANANLAPPGYYMLFIVNGNGVPSVASFVQFP